MGNVRFKRTTTVRRVVVDPAWALYMHVMAAAVHTCMSLLLPRMMRMPGKTYFANNRRTSLSLVLWGDEMHACRFLRHPEPDIPGRCQTNVLIQTLTQPWTGPKHQPGHANPGGSCANPGQLEGKHDACMMINLCTDLAAGSGLCSPTDSKGESAAQKEVGPFTHACM